MYVCVREREKEREGGSRKERQRGEGKERGMEGMKEGGKEGESEKTTCFPDHCSLALKVIPPYVDLKFIVNLVTQDPVLQDAVPLLAP